jgi:hypothetical protein
VCCAILDCTMCKSSLGKLRTVSLGILLGIDHTIWFGEVCDAVTARRLGQGSIVAVHIRHVIRGGDNRRITV